MELHSFCRLLYQKHYNKCLSFKRRALVVGTRPVFLIFFTSDISLFPSIFFSLLLFSLYFFFFKSLSLLFTFSHFSLFLSMSLSHSYLLSISLCPSFFIDDSIMYYWFFNNLLIETMDYWLTSNHIRTDFWIALIEMSRTSAAVARAFCLVYWVLDLWRARSRRFLRGKLQ